MQQEPAALTRPSARVLQVKQQMGIVGNAPGLNEAVERALRVAPIDLSVLVIGESGTGKEFFPKIIHRYSARKHAKYIAVNCGAIPEGTIDSELFGHEKGAFTGAVASRKGYFEEADGGTIFLDEVAELPLTTQARLLRVLETGEFIKVGSSTVQKTNIRIVAATNVDMHRAVEEGRFREDLYYRLSTVQINIPPLRDRGSDIRLLARKFASDFAEHYHLPPIEMGESARAALMHYRWPGNVRQLKNVVEQISLFQAGTEVTAEVVHSYLPSGAGVYTPTLSGARDHSYEREREMLFNMIFRLQTRIEELSERLDSGARPSARHSHAEAVDSYEDLTSTTPAPLSTSLVKLDTPPLHMPDTEARTTEERATETHTAETRASEAQNAKTHAPEAPASLEQQERAAIAEALERTSGRRKMAAAELGISERTLYRKIKEYGLE